MTANSLKDWRQRLGISQTMAAPRIGVCLSMIKKLEAGHRQVTKRIQMLMWYNEKHGPPPDELMQ